tara:strand:- start:282 stop:902 length:621 start_codon:yes stop_codon:yes gene_type:complete
MLRVNDIFYTIQGEGYHAGTPSIFIRLSQCNLTCSFCDTEFLYGEPRPVDWIITEVKKKGQDCKFIVLTGGEPSMHDIGPLVRELKKNKYYVMIETNGMFKLPKELDWVCCAPKIRPQSKKHIVKTANEFKFVVGVGGKMPNIEGLSAEHFWLSPMNHTSINKKIKVGEKGCTEVSPSAASYCVKMVKDNPRFKLNLQMHKYIGVE